MEEVRQYEELNVWYLQVVKPAERPAPVDLSLGLDVVVRWHREWDAQTLDVLPQPRDKAQPY